MPDIQASIDQLLSSARRKAAQHAFKLSAGKAGPPKAGHKRVRKSPSKVPAAQQETRWTKGKLQLNTAHLAKAWPEVSRIANTLTAHLPGEEAEVKASGILPRLDDIARHALLAGEASCAETLAALATALREAHRIEFAKQRRSSVPEAAVAPAAKARSTEPLTKREKRRRKERNLRLAFGDYAYDSLQRFKRAVATTCEADQVAKREAPPQSLLHLFHPVDLLNIAIFNGLPLDGVYDANEDHEIPRPGTAAQLAAVIEAAGEQEIALPERARHAAAGIDTVREECRTRGLATTGSLVNLVVRLEAAERDERAAKEAPWKSR